jgi:hypothetical protein
MVICVAVIIPTKFTINEKDLDYDLDNPPVFDSTDEFFDQDEPKDMDG